VSRVFDDKELLDRIDHDWEFLTETVQMLASDGPALVDQIRRAADTGDAGALGRAAHMLKGMVANFCSPAAHASAFELEKMGRSGDLSLAPAAVKTLEGHLDLLIASLNEFLATRS
jgi:HPt (histidine-containing phosphotransfer) domain-containing protein